MRIRRQDFLPKKPRTQKLLGDIPLHDVWAFDLRGGLEGRTLRDFQELFSAESLQEANPVVGALFKLRWALDRLFGWDRETPGVPESSYLHRLSESDRTESLEGSPTFGPFRLIYASEDETLYEIINLTAHSLLLMTFERTPDGYRACWAVYVKKVSWMTPIYMALIDPFRWLLVYPPVIRMMERKWTAGYGGDQG